MALFQKKPAVEHSLPYTLGNQRTVLIIGLGNPGAGHAGSRHNVGFEVLDYFADKNDFPKWISKKDLKCEFTSQTLGETKVLLVKPTTFMNASGEAAQAVQHFYKVYNPQTLVVYDELAIPFGQLRTRVGGSDAGHNGVKSLISHIGDDFNRLRIGIHNELTDKKDQADFVLAKFSKEEQAGLPVIHREANAMITEFIFGGQLPHDTRTVL